MTNQIGDRQAMFKREKNGKPAAALTMRRSDNSLVLADGRNGTWTPYELRRTGATMMQAIGVLLNTIDRCQNHVLKGSEVRRHYLHYDYAKQKREAWELLSVRLRKLLT